MTTVSIDDIDALLPQTQCGLCGYAGCKPYATAIIEAGEQINRCPPGGEATLRQLGTLMQIDTDPYVAEMRAKTKPPQIAVIREAECIGCMKCIEACPVDAIIGSAKLMHTIISSECTGCERCVAPCPVDCIDLYEVEAPLSQARKALARQRYENRQTRLSQNEITTPPPTLSRKDYIAASLARSKAKKS